MKYGGGLILALGIAGISAGLLLVGLIRTSQIGWSELLKILPREYSDALAMVFAGLALLAYSIGVLAGIWAAEIEAKKLQAGKLQ